MIAPLDLAALLVEPARVADVPAERLPALLAQLAAEQARLAALQGALAARLAAADISRARKDRDEEAALVDNVQEVGRLIHRSESWVRKHGHTLPGFHQPGGKGTKVAWSRRALLASLNGPS